MASRLDLAIVVLSLLFEKLGSLPIPLSDPGERRRECLQKIAPLQRFWPPLRFDHRFGSRPFRPAAFRTFKHFHVRKFLDVAQAILKLAMAACRRHEAVWAGRHLSSPLARAASLHAFQEVRLIRWEGGRSRFTRATRTPCTDPRHQPAGVYWPSHIIGLQPRLGTTLQNRRNHMRLIVK